MEKVSVDRVLLFDLLEFKIRSISESIEVILAHWNIKSSSKFLQDAEAGVLSESEMDTIAVKQLISERNKLKSILKSY
jgi:hypothetical protein